MSVRSFSNNDEEQTLYTLTFTYPQYINPETKRGGYYQIEECSFDILGKVTDISEFIEKHSAYTGRGAEYFVRINKTEGGYVKNMYFENNKDYENTRNKLTELLKKGSSLNTYVPFQVMNFDDKAVLDNKRYVQGIHRDAIHLLKRDYNGTYHSNYPERSNSLADHVPYPDTNKKARTQPFYMSSSHDMSSSRYGW